MTALSLFDPLDCLSPNQRVLLEIQQTFGEIEDDDCRLAIVLAYARIHRKIIELVAIRCCRQTNGRTPGLWKTQTSSLHRAGVLDDDFYKYLLLLARVRNGICHRVTDRRTLVHNFEYFENIRELHRLSSGVQYWSSPFGPDGDLHRSVLAICVAGCLAIELDGFPKGFEIVRQFQEGCNNG